jgi:hypothetical protein
MSLNIHTSDVIFDKFDKTIGCFTKLNIQKIDGKHNPDLQLKMRENKNKLSEFIKTNFAIWDGYNMKIPDLNEGRRPSPVNRMIKGMKLFFNEKGKITSKIPFMRNLYETEKNEKSKKMKRLNNLAAFAMNKIKDPSRAFKLNIDTMLKDLPQDERKDFLTKNEKLLKIPNKNLYRSSTMVMRAPFKLEDTLEKSSDPHDDNEEDLFENFKTIDLEKYAFTRKLKDFHFKSCSQTDFNKLNLIPEKLNLKKTLTNNSSSNTLNYKFRNTQANTIQNSNSIITDTNYFKNMNTISVSQNKEFTTPAKSSRNKIRLLSEITETTPTPHTDNKTITAPLHLKSYSSVTNPPRSIFGDSYTNARLTIDSKFKEINQTGNKIKKEFTKKLKKLKIPLKKGNKLVDQFDKEVVKELNYKFLKNKKISKEVGMNLAAVKVKGYSRNIDSNKAHLINLADNFGKMNEKTALFLGEKIKNDYEQRAIAAAIDEAQEFKKNFPYDLTKEVGPKLSENNFKLKKIQYNIIQKQVNIKNMFNKINLNKPQKKVTNSPTKKMNKRD